MSTDHSPTRLIEWCLLLRCMSPVVALFEPEGSGLRCPLLRAKRTSQPLAHFGAQDEFLLAATAQNLRKLAKLVPLSAPMPA